VNAASSTAFKILDNGSIGVASTSPWALFSINPAIGLTNPAFVVGSSTATNLIVANSGNVGVGTTTPWRKFSVAGTVTFNGLTSSATGNALCITTTKDVTDAGGGTCTPSSERFKENVLTLGSGEAIRQLGALRVVTFDYKPDFASPEESPSSIGVIAEEVEKVNPLLVDYGYDGKPLTVHFERLTALTIQAVQEQQKTIADMASTTGISALGPNATHESYITYLAGKITDAMKEMMVSIKSVFVKEVHVEEKLCVDDVCIDKEGLKNLIRQANTNAGLPANGAPSTGGTTTSGSTTGVNATTTDTTSNSTTTTTGGSGSIIDGSNSTTTSTGTTTTPGTSEPFVTNTSSSTPSDTTSSGTTSTTGGGAVIQPTPAPSPEPAPTPTPAPAPEPQPQPEPTPSPTSDSNPPASEPVVN
jgi:hypothetical protein